MGKWHGNVMWESARAGGGFAELGRPGVVLTSDRGARRSAKADDTKCATTNVEYFMV